MNVAGIAPIAVDSEDLFEGYRPPPGVYDEMLSSDGEVRTRWKQFTQLLRLLGPQELNRRWDQARRLIHENGVTYNVHGDPQGRDRRWELDALPLVVDPQEWALISAALVQRATLLNAVLADLYGPQNLLREGPLPSELVFADPHFLRPCHGWAVPGNRYLHLYAAHLARCPSGEWRVLADRTEAPVGAGYAVENRIAVSRMIPHVFHQCQIERLAGFFITLRGSLGALAARNRDNPHIVLLSSGPTSPTYFEDSYLARYLGYTLVEGEDLTVRDNRVYLKTLGGLVPVDVVLRRVRDADCDPLELEAHARPGVPGLVHAARRGNVVLANALGSGLVESPTLMAFLPAICQRLLGEPLKIPSVQTWWCGDEASRAYVLGHLDQLLIRSAISDPAGKLVYGASLAQSQREELVARITAAPGKFVAQEVILRSTAPVWGERGLVPGHVALRTFAAATQDTYQVLPGGLAHVSARAETTSPSMFVGHGSKDVWVRSDRPVAPLTLLEPPGATVVRRRGGIDLPSRVADGLFWLGRNVERAEASTRLLRSIVTRIISESVPSNLRELAVLYRALTGTSWDNGEPAGDSAALETRVIAFLYDRNHAGSLQNLLEALARVATVVRDRISIDTWRILNRIDDDFHPGYPLGVASLADVLAMLNQMILNFSAFSGVATENMTRGPGWQFLDLGRRIERALSMISLLRTTLFVPDGNENGVFEALLEIADSSMTYRNRYATSLSLVPVLDLLMIDESNPRSIGYQLAALSAHVERAPRQQVELPLSEEQRIVISVLSTIRLVDVTTLGEATDSGVRQTLDRFLNDLATQLYHLAECISHKYLVHAGQAHQLSEVNRG